MQYVVSSYEGAVQKDVHVISYMFSEIQIICSMVTIMMCQDLPDHQCDHGGGQNLRKRRFTKELIQVALIEVVVLQLQVIKDAEDLDTVMMMMMITTTAVIHLDEVSDDSHFLDDQLNCAIFL